MRSVFRWMDEPDEELAAERLKIFAFTVALANVSLLHSTIMVMQIDMVWQYAFAILPAAWLGVVAVGTGRARIGMFAHMLIVGGAVAIAYPGVPNHSVLQLYLAAILSCLYAERRDAPWVVGGLRWIFLIVVFASGVQKLAHGSYWSGSYFGWTAAADLGAKMHWILHPLIAESEIARLQAMRSTGASGPYIPDSWLLLAMSRAVLIGELLVPLLALVEQYRRWAIPAIALMFASIAVASRELTFGCLMLGLAALSMPLRYARIVVVLQVVAIALGMLVRTFFPFTMLN